MRTRARHEVHAQGKRGLGPPRSFVRREGIEQHTFMIDAGHLAQLKRAAHLENVFYAYAISIGCTIVHDEITATDEQALLLRSWWEEHRL
jgi:hypothetical protein